MPEPMPTNTRERLIHALDVPTTEDAKARVKLLGDAVVFYKLGLELLMDARAFDLIKWLRDADKKVFADFKFFDIPNTVAAAVRRLSEHDVQFATIHGNDATLEAAAREKGRLKLFAITVLSSVTQNDLSNMGLRGDLEEWAHQRALRAQALGCDGVVCSGKHIAMVRKALQPKQLIIAPGIRPQGLQSVQKDDQKHTVDVRSALATGADYVVVGRPIAQGSDPRANALQIQKEIANGVN